MCYDLVSVHLIAQVCTAAGNMLAGNTLRESQPCMMRFFSTHIAAGEFDPTEDVVSQLEALNIMQPCSIPNFQALMSRQHGHANEFSVEVAGSAEMEAEKIMVRACVSRSVLAMSVTHAMQVCTGVRKLLQAFDFGVDKCGVTRTVHVDPQRSGPFQVFNVFVCVVLVYTNLLLIFLQAFINRIISADKSGYRNSSNLEVSHDQFFLLRF